MVFADQLGLETFVLFSQLPFSRARLLSARLENDGKILEGVALPQIELARLYLGLLADCADGHLVDVVTAKNR